MTKVIQDQLRYATDVAGVFATITDRAFIEAKYAALGHTEVEITELAPTANGGFRISTRRSVESAGIPSFAKKVFGERQTVVMTEEWGPAAADGTRTSTWSVETKGTPATVKGTSSLRPDGDGAVMAITGELKIGVPLIGGKLEDAVLPVLTSQLRDELEFGETWTKP